MGYSKSKRAIRRVEDFLRQMTEAQADISFPADDAAKTAYHIREGIKVSAHFASEEPFKSYATLNVKYIIRTKGNGIICELRDSTFGSAGKATFGQVQIEDVVDVLGIIGAAITHKAPMMVFPDASDETVVDKNRLQTWCDNNNYTLVISDNHVTLTRKS